MTVVMDMPKACQPCETCGHVQDPARRYAWLAGCPDGHRVYQLFDVAWLEQRFVHTWPDKTYSAVRIEHVADGEALALLWLDLVHAAQTKRRRFEPGCEPEYERLVAEQHVDPATGDITVTWHLPPPAEGRA